MPLIVNGQVAVVTNFPWHATLYVRQRNNKKRFICGGTIINQDLIVTAAHCVYNEAFKRFENPNNFYIAIGNYHREYDSPSHSQFVVKKQVNI